MKSIRSILHILLGVTLICSCNEATELAHITAQSHKSVAI